MAAKQDRKSCQQMKRDGERCRANPLTGSRYCVFHDPQKTEERAAARRAGGVARSHKAVVLPPHTPDRPIEDAADVVDLMSATINQVIRGELDPRIANSVGFLASVALKALELGLEEGVQFVNVVAQERQRDESAEADAGPSEFDEPPGSDDEK